MKFRKPSETVIFALLVIAVVVVIFVLTGCGAPPVTTSTGAVVPAAIVITQDQAADLLGALEQSYNEEARAYNAAPVKPAADFKRLQQHYAALKTGLTGVQTWKKLASPLPPPAVFCDIAVLAPTMLQLGAAYGVISATDEPRYAQLAVALAKGGGCP